jgi:adenylate cyclase
MTFLVITVALLVGYPLAFRQTSMLNEQMELLGESLAKQAATNAIEPIFADEEFELERLIQSIKEQENIRSVIFVNKDLKVFGHSDWLPSATQKGSGLLKSEKGNVAGYGDVQWFYQPISFQEVFAGTVWIGLDKTPLIISKRFSLGSLLFAILVLVMGIIWLSIRLSHYLSHPINELIKAVNAIDTGQYSFRIHSSLSGEFAQVKEAFNKMAANLEQKLTLEKNISRFVSVPVANHYMKREESELTRQGERVEASILFVDLVSYTQFSEQHSPEVVAEVLNMYFSEFANACHRFNGNVDKFIGDCAMLVFGCPAEDNQHRQHALECALYIRDRIKEINARRLHAHLPWMDIRIGLAGGTVLAGLLGSSERLTYSVIGEAANLAARLCDQAPRGGILTDNQFLAALGDDSAIRAHQAQRINVKGFSYPIDALVIDQWVAIPSAKRS